jgi:hypothetical protein
MNFDFDSITLQSTCLKTCPYFSKRRNRIKIELIFLRISLEQLQIAIESEVRRNFLLSELNLQNVFFFLSVARISLCLNRNKQHAWIQNMFHLNFLTSDKSIIVGCQYKMLKLLISKFSYHNTTP